MQNGVLSVFRFAVSICNVRENICQSSFLKLGRVDNNNNIGLINYLKLSWFAQIFLKDLLTEKSITVI